MSTGKLNLAFFSCRFIILLSVLKTKDFQMVINTKYDIGYTFWVPRSYADTSYEELIFEGETWKREVVDYSPAAKQKVIKKIEAFVNADNSTQIFYYVVNVGSEDELSSVYEERDITSFTEEEAFALAKTYAEQNKVYLGTGSN